MRIIAAVAALFVSVMPESRAAVARIKPLGDSITRGFHFAYPNLDIPGGYRKELGARLANAGFQFDFVGSLSSNSVPGMDPHHEGHNGLRTDEILANLPTWLAVAPDTVLLMAGTNDILQGIPVATAAANLDNVILQISANAPARRLYVGTIIPVIQDWNGYTAAVLNANVNLYNTEVRKLVLQHANLGRKVTLVDLNAQLVLTGPAGNFFEPGDGIHPGQAGYNQLGKLWFDAITASGSLLDPPPVPVPGGLAAEAIGTSQVQLSWLLQSGNEFGFKLERKTGAAGSFVEIASLAAATSSFMDSGLDAGTPYFYRMRAFKDSDFSAFTTEVPVTTAALTGYDLWASAYPAFMALPPAGRLPDADANGDGVSNLSAYAAGLDPMGNSPGALLAALVMLSPVEAMFRFRRNKLAPDLTYEVLVSSDLAESGWSVLGLTGAVVTDVEGSPGAEEVSVPVVQVPGESGKFLRLRVVKN